LGRLKGGDKNGEIEDFSGKEGLKKESGGFDGTLPDKYSSAEKAKNSGEKRRTA